MYLKILKYNKICLFRIIKYWKNKMFSQNIKMFWENIKMFWQTIKLEN